MDEDLRAIVEKMAAHEGLRVLWSGRLKPNDPMCAIAEDPETHRRYTVPGLQAWRDPLPGEHPPAKVEAPRPLQGQLSLF